MYCLMLLGLLDSGLSYVLSSSYRDAEPWSGSLSLQLFLGRPAAPPILIACFDCSVPHL